MNALRAVSLAPLLLAAGAVLCPLPCQVPTTVEQIPAYPGATRQTEREQEVNPSEPGLRIYVVRAPIEDVVRFYQQRLRAREVKTEAEFQSAWDAYEQLAAGQVTPALMWPEIVDLTPEYFAKNSESGEDPAKLAAAWRAAYTQKRAPFRPGTWLHGADFGWGVALTAGQRVAFMVRIQDIGAWQIREPEYFHETEIQFGTQTVGAPVTEAPEEPEEERPVAPMAAPSAGELEVPLYPGASFDGRLSAELSHADEEANYYVYTSGDAPATITAFYERRTGKKGQVTEVGVLIVVRGEGPFPDLAVTVQPNPGSHPASVKTVITVRQRR